MKLVGVLSTAVLSLALGVAVPAFAQEQHEQEEQKAPAAQNEKKAQPEKSTKQAEPAAQQEKNAKPEEKNAQQENKNTKPAEKNAQQQQKNTKPAEKNAQPQQRAGNDGGGRIPDAKFKANFGQQHSFRVTQADYSNHRFQYGGYSFGFVDPWPSNWLYTQNVYVIEINGVYYLCNASFPGVNLALSFTP
jgi:hypothetical protein